MIGHRPHALGLSLGTALALSILGGAGCGAAGEEPGGGDAGGTAGWDYGGAGGTNTTGTESAAGNNPQGKQAGGHGKEVPAESVADANAPLSLPVCKSDAAAVPFYMSSDDSNSMASPALAREYLNAEMAPPAGQIRTYEFLNYYNATYDIPAMEDGELGVHFDMQDLGVSTEDSFHRFRLQVGVQAFQVPRVPLVLTYVIDTSGSLVGAGMERERAALLAIATHLQEEDIVNVVTWSTKDSVLLEGYVAKGGGEDQDALAKVLANLAPGGGSDLHSGLTKGYDLAQAHFDVNKLNRVVLLSDGGANLGVLDRDVIAKAAEQAEEEGIYLVGVGVGPYDGYTDALMDIVTDSGRGAYVYLDSPEEAQSVFNARFDEVMNIAARDVQVEVRLPPYLEIESFYGEEYSTDIHEIKPQNLAPGDSMVLNETLFVTNLGEMCGQDLVSVTVHWKTPLKHEDQESDAPAVTLQELLNAEISPQMRKANAVISYAEALKTGDPTDLANALQAVMDARPALPEKDADLDAIALLIPKHPALSHQ